MGVERNGGNIHGIIGAGPVWRYKACAYHDSGRTSWVEIVAVCANMSL